MTSAPDQLSVLVRKGSFGLVDESEYEAEEEDERVDEDGGGEGSMTPESGL